MKRQSGTGIIRPGIDARGAGGSSYFQRRVQPAASQAPAKPPAETAPADSTPTEPKASPPRLQGLNAIAVLTNHPNKAPARIHRSDLPTVPHTHYPKIKLSDFDEYLNDTSALFEQYATHANSGYQVAVDELNRYEVAVDDAEKVLEIASHTYSMDSTTMAERLKTLDGTRSEFGLDSISEYGGGHGDGAAARALPGIEDVPNIFFAADFDLRDPATFDIVTQVVLGPMTASAGLFAPEKVSEASTAMQDALSGYMDVVEGYLTREISRRSPSFFAALSTLEELHAETDRCIEKIHLLRDDLKKTAYTQCSPGLELIRLRRRRDNLTASLGCVELLSSLRQALTAVDELIDSGDYISALNLLIEAQELAHSARKQTQKPDRASLTTVSGSSGLAETAAFRGLSARMGKSMRLVSVHAERELAAIVLRDMREFVDDGLSGEQNGLLDRDHDGLLSRSRVDIYQANLAMQLTPFVCGLARTENIGSALKAYRENLLAETTGLIESLYPSEFPRSQSQAMFNDASQQRALGAAVRGQTFDQFCRLLRQQEELLLLVIGHVSMVRRTFLQILDESQPADSTSSPPPPATSQVGQHHCSAGSGARSLNLASPSIRYDAAKTEVQRSLNDTFDELMDLAHMRCAKLLNHRSEQNARLSLAGFYSLYTWISRFIAQYERLGGKMCFGLRGTLTAQAKAFLTNFHAEKSRQIQILIENEQWVQAEVPIDFQTLVNRVVEAAQAIDGSDEPNPLSLADTALSASASAAPGSGSVSARPPLASIVSPSPSADPATMMRTESDAASVRSLDMGVGRIHIGDMSFHAVGCSLVLVKTVVEYLQCGVSVAALAPDVLQRLVEIFKIFNSRTCQVVLGAGAMRSAGLKNISAKHLALASESLALCMELIPHVRECLRRVMAPTQEGLLAQLGRAVQDFISHQHELHAKLVEIMTDRADYHARMLGATDWDALDGAPPAPAMDALVKEVRKLHKVLKRYLPPSVLRSVFAEIFSMYETKLTAQYHQLRISTGTGKRQLMTNSQYLLRRLRLLDASPVDWELEVVVNNIDLVRPHPSASVSVPVSPDHTPDPVSAVSDLLTPSVTHSPVGEFDLPGNTSKIASCASPDSA
ncbi:hypothetical protein H4S02_000199 [Coemansia sp. RSA 2611]|nr:hypothetical protein H4S02_000199 [Coemansia sp. RSA 2611]KAJ2739718.1 hypothetical protein H4R23_000261 [Coemansia sp. Cherry 401B]